MRVTAQPFQKIKEKTNTSRFNMHGLSKKTIARQVMRLEWSAEFKAHILKLGKSVRVFDITVGSGACTDRPNSNERYRQRDATA